MIRRWLFSVLLLIVAAAPSTARAVASAELYGTQPYGFGRFEARLRFAPGDGVVSSFFLWKNGSEMAGVYWNELDFEKLGADCDLQTNALHGNPAEGHEQLHALPSDLCGAYHDYTFEWTPTYIAWAIDGQEIRRDTGQTAAAFAENASGGMTFHFNVWPGNGTFGGNFDPAILPVHQYISWVRYSAYVDGSFAAKWREEFDAPTLPSGWATGDWLSPHNLSTHVAQNVSFVDGIAVLSLTADEATGFAGAPPADVSSSVGTAGSGASNDGCGCRVTRSRARGFAVAIAGLLALALARRRRRPSSTRPEQHAWSDPSLSSGRSKALARRPRSAIAWITLALERDPAVRVVRALDPLGDEVFRIELERRA
jgi:hypothetical protein